MRVPPASVAEAYSLDALSLVLGPTYHPGGLDLTGRLGSWMRVPRGSRVLDVASGPGASARYLADWFGWRVVGIDASPANARRAALAADGGDAAFLSGDALRLPFRPRAFDAAVCECSLCLFGDEGEALRGVAGVVRAGGRLGMSDVVLAEDAPRSPALRSALAAVACLAGARTVDALRGAMEGAGIRVDRVEDASWAIRDLLESLRSLARRAEDLGLGDVRVRGFSLRQVAELLDEAWGLHRDGHLGYAVLVGTVDP